MRDATRTAVRPLCASQLRRRRRATLLLARGLNSDGRIAYGRNVLQAFGWVGSDMPRAGGAAASRVDRC
jgi:hypothetical protein